MTKRLVNAQRVGQEATIQLQQLMDSSPGTLHTCLQVIVQGKIYCFWSKDSMCGQDVAQWAEEEKAELSHSRRPEQGYSHYNDIDVDFIGYVYYTEEERMQSLARERWFLLGLKKQVCWYVIHECVACV